MSVTERQAEAVRAGWPDRLRRTTTRTRVLAATGVAVLVAAIITGAVLWRESASYDPLRAVGWYGARPDTAMHVRWANDLDNAHRLLGPPGTSQEFEFGLINDGSHPLTITGIDQDPWIGPGANPVSDITWAAYHEIPGGLINGTPSQSQPFPAHMSAHGIIKIRFTVTKPACPPTNGTYLGVSARMHVHWEAMISSHTTTIDPAGNDYLIVLCGN